MSGYVIDWSIVAASAAVASALFAGWQIRESRVAALRQASMDLLREVQEKALAAADVDGRSAKIGVLNFYSRKSDALSADSLRYIHYLTALDRLLYALDKKTVAPDLVRPWLRGLLRPRESLIEFIEQAQAACGDDCLLEYLHRHLCEERRALKKGTNT